jgi:hypothetical protein
VRAAVDVIRSGETVLALIDPASRGRDPDAFGRWLSARLAIAELPRLVLPPCDARCVAVDHLPDAAVVLADLALDAIAARDASTWGGWNASLDRQFQGGRVWFAGAPAMPMTPADRRLAAGTAVRRVARTDPHAVAYDGAPLETLYQIEEGPMASDALIATTFGHSPLLPALSGVLIAPDHPPVRDRRVAVRLLAAGWAAVERGLPDEE